MLPEFLPCMLAEMEMEKKIEELDRSSFEEEEVANLKLNSSPIRKLSKFYAKANSRGSAESK